MAGRLVNDAAAVGLMPAALATARAPAQVRLPKPVVDALLVWVDLGPDPSITGSLATML